MAATDPTPTRSSLLYELLGKRWTALIIRQLVDGPKRFRELLIAMPNINDKVLAQRLKELQQHQILTRQVFAEVPVRVEYSLTERGEDLKPVIAAIDAWNARWDPDGA
ncbi:putative transcriptional repressor of catechol dioxygenase [Candidatus Hydrogenisulfobacillus filiaventi]|uniref:Putative transcriptional repressor of catechol dioxygenase n=1 Tax=Candidatus Hydrogenisulfobacillus filiaventi TaxID=2707344 RepID=A0A6F8ZH26_9FIRM|nr:winged helix-turn-helix transcriptional regulator [Bacillota bacterium]CAB1128979.1 putative transcriptional repressor of catechol dioxygenase [Candidatus Hydrogenisulfobacillus filiaventi]